MSHESESRSSLSRFFESFFQERNIRWMLGIGMLILLGSSMMLVKSQWQAYTPFWKYLVLIAYTTAVFLWGEISYFRLGLRKTGTVLQSLTVLLLPMSFAALRWIRPESGITLANFAGQAGLLILLAMNFAVACYAATRIFKHFLRRSQPTFVAAYLILCVAGAILPVLPGVGGIAAIVILWAVFTIGTVKVNRHVFWLTEERRLPRVFGFFPIALLGTQFATLFAFNLAPHIPMQWMGLACALVAVPVMLTADAVLGVFQQRTGNLMRPLPWSLILPTGVGLVLCVTGLSLAATGWPQPFAMVPTAALVAVMMGVTAHRTRHVGFVWGMLVSVMLAYNFMPVFFVEAAKSVLQIGADAVREQRLPFAFYGLTYLPLLSGLIFFGWWTGRRKNDVFARPIRRFTAGLSTVLLLASLGHVKAVFPVGLAMTAAFTMQALLYRDRRLLIGGVASWISAAVGLTPFLVQVLGVAVPPDMQFLSLGIAAALLLWPGRWLDQRRRFTSQKPGIHGQVLSRFCQVASLAMTLILSVVWLQRFGLQATDVACWISGTILAVLLAVHALVWLKPGLGEAATVFAGLVGLTQSIRLGVPMETIHTTAAVILATMWFIAPRLRASPAFRFSRAFGAPLHHVSLTGLSVLLVFNTVTECMSAAGTNTLTIAWIPCVLVILWAFDAARRVPHAIFSAAGCVSLLAFASCAWMASAQVESAANWLPALWAALGLAAVPLCVRFGRFPKSPGVDASQHSAEALMRPIVVCTVGLLIAVGVMSLFIFSTPLRVAGGIAAAGLLLLAVLRSEPLVRRFAAVVANWQLISLVVQWFTPGNVSILDVTISQAAACSLPVAAVAAISLLASMFFRREKDPRIEQLLQVHRGLLQLLTGLAVFTSLNLMGGGLTIGEIALAAVPFVAFTFIELSRACATGNAERVWLAEAVAAMGFGYFLLFGVIPAESSVCMYLALGTGILLWSVGRVAEQRTHTAVLSQPFTLTGTALPLLAVGLGVFRHLTVPNPEWLGVNSLALLAAAAFYFWRGIDRKEKPFLVLSAVVLNVGLTLLWRELRFSDPQFFMIPIGISVLWLVQILKHEIPDRLHDPLLYLGALVILVSPVFHIVGGSWIHLVTLMIASIAITLVAIGLRIRAITYTGTAFLAADVVAMVVRGSIDHPMLLWAVGILVGVGVIGLAAYCEKHRELLLSRMRRLAAELESWE